MWQSPDPILDQYLDGDPAGGVYVTPNLSLYTYAHNRPVIMHDPDGKVVKLAVSAGKLIYKAYRQYRKTGKIDSGTLKKIGGDEAADIAGDLYTIFGDSSASVYDKVKAGVDLVTGLETNNKGQDTVRKIAEDLAGKVSKQKDKVAKGPISVDEALGKASKFLKDGVPVKSIDGKTGVQFIQEFTENGQKITKRAGFDLNPNSSHVKQLGSHLNLQTQINGKIQKGALADPHIPIDPKTIRPGDY